MQALLVVLVFAAHAVGSGIYAVGGNLSSVERLDVVAGASAWVSAPSLSTARHMLAAAVVNGAPWRAMR